MRIARCSNVVTMGLVAGTVGVGVALTGVQVSGGWGSTLGLVPAVFILGYGLRRAVRRWHLAQQSFPEAWRQWLNAHVPLYRAVDDAATAHFERDVQFAMAEYSFEGVSGVDVSEELRLAVAAGIATLLHGRPNWELPGTQSVVFYPGAFNDEYGGRGYDASYDGMAHQQGPLLLTAPSVRDSWRNPGDGDNVVLHELAHLFDFDNAGADGVPSLVARSSAEDWQVLVRSEMKRIREGRSILRRYAAEAPSEFFAVAVEVFFEQPARMERHHEALFNALVAFFHIDPATGKRQETSGRAGS